MGESYLHLKQSELDLNEQRIIDDEENDTFEYDIHYMNRKHIKSNANNSLLKPSTYAASTFELSKLIKSK